MVAVKILSAIITICVAIAACAIVAKALLRFNRAVEFGKNGYILSKKGHSTIFFERSCDANFFIGNATKRGEVFDIHILNNGIIEYIGQSNHFILS